MDYVIGVDSGGTHIVAHALSTTGELLAESSAGPGNIMLDADQTIKNLKQAISDLRTRVDGTNTFILLGIAGIETAGLTASLEDTLSSIYEGTEVKVMSDAKLALLNGLQGEDGTLVIAGTGSVVYGKKGDDFFRAGGHGPILGDEGSAYRIVISAIQEMFRDFDEGTSSKITPTLLKAFSANDELDVQKKIYQLNRKEIAQKALFIADAADQGLLVAIDIISTEASFLAESILKLISRYDVPIPPKLVLSGSVLLKNKMFQKSLLDEVTGHYRMLEVAEVEANNADGVLYYEKWK